MELKNTTKIRQHIFIRIMANLLHGIDKGITKEYSEGLARD